MLRTVPEHYLELENIYAATLARGLRTLAVTASEAGEGVTSVVAALANRNLHAGRSTLIVDFNLFRPGLHDHFNLGVDEPVAGMLPPPRCITRPDSAAPLAIVAPRPDRNSLIRLREPGAIERQLVDWKQDYDSILVDTSPVNQINGSNLPAERVAASCDGALFVVLAGVTAEMKVAKAIARLQRAGSNIVGNVLNDRENPTLKQEMLRETQRIEPYLPRLAKWFTQRLHASSLLHLEV
jgi:protein-tyrosine kinase